MISRRCLHHKLFAAFLACCLGIRAAFADETAARQFSVSPAPAWAFRYEVDFAYANSVTNPDSEGEEYILVDQQHNAATAQFYNHLTRKITSQNGVQNGSRIEIDFDPSFQQLMIHDVLIVRDGKLLDRLDPAKVKVIQQESGLDRHLFNGEFSAVLFLEDVRVGDIIDYAYSTTGENPILKGHFLSSFVPQWADPVHQQRYRVLFPKTKRLTVWNHGVDAHPTYTNTAGLVDCRWAFDDAKPYVFEDSVPASVESYAWIQLTDFSSWREVVDWALPFYAAAENAPLSDELLKKISAWKSLSPVEQVRNALRFVQDDVRYLGIEIGQYSHQPNPPDVVFARRFGDCKDKAVLLCAILKQLNIEAAPVLVHSFRGASLDKWAPSPYAFNHVVTRVNLYGRFLWFDSTIAYQRGPLDEIAFPDYSTGLVLAPGTDALTKIPMQSGHTAAVTTQTFRYTSYSKPATYEIHTVKRGADADQLRAYLAGTTHDALQRSLLNRHAKTFPDIQSTRPPVIRDNEELNEITLDQSYTISNEWDLTEDKTRYSLTLTAQGIFDFAELPATTIRAKPLEVAYPYNFKEKITVILPENGTFPNETEHEASSAVRFDRKVTYSNRVLNIDFSLQTLTNAVSPAQLSQHLTALKGIRDKAFYYINRPREDAPEKASGPNWPILALAGCFCLVAAGGSLAAYRFRPRLTTPPLLDSPRELTGLGGWLTLPTLGLFVRFISVAIYLVRYRGVYSLTRWNQLTDPGHASYNPNYAPLLLFELFWNLTNIFVIPLLLVLFFQKRYAFPRYMIAFIVLYPLALAIDQAWTTTIPALQTHHRAGDPQLPSVFFATILWISYYLKSRRVKYTFVR